MQEKKEQILFLQFSSHTEEKFHPLIAKKKKTKNKKTHYSSNQ